MQHASGDIMTPPPLAPLFAAWLRLPLPLFALEVLARRSSRSESSLGAAPRVDAMVAVAFIRGCLVLFRSISRFGRLVDDKVRALSRVHWK